MEEIIEEIAETIHDAKHIIVIQAENPDGDSLASALALEHILGDQGKTVSMYCPVIIPRHLRHLPGWDRVSDDLPRQFDASIVVDTSSQLLMERVFSDSQLPILRSRPMITIDHHETESDMPFMTIDLLEEQSVATGEVIFNLSNTLGWNINDAAADMIVTSIMSDSLGLTTPATTAASIQVVADLVKNGVKLYELDAARRESSKRLPEITHFKGELLQRIEFHLDNALATVDITWDDIQSYSDKYNPSVLVLDEMRMTTGVKIAIAYKTYPDGKILAKIRSNLEAPFANTIAEHFGSGGHQHAAGFKLRGRDIEEVKQEVIALTKSLLEQTNE